MSLGIQAGEKEMEKAAVDASGLASMIVALQQQERSIETLKLEIVERERHITELIEAMADLPEVQRLVEAVCVRESVSALDDGLGHSPFEARILTLLSKGCPSGASAQVVAQKLGASVIITEQSLWNLEAVGLATHGDDGLWKCA